MRLTGFLILAYDALVIFDYLYLSRRPGLPENYRYSAETVFSDIFQKAFFEMRKFFLWVAVFKYGMIGFLYPLIYQAIGRPSW